MKVLMLVDKPLPSERPTGIGMAAFNMALALSRRQKPVNFVCRGGTKRTIRWNDYLTIQTLVNYTRDNLTATLELLRTETSDIVHVHSSSALPSLVLSRALDRRVLMHSHGDEPLRPIGRTLMRNIGMKLSHRVVAVSRRTRADLIRNHHVPPGKVVVAYNGVDTDEFRPSPAQDYVSSKYGLERHDRMMLSLGTLQERKGQSKIIECLPRLLQKWPNLVYVSIGAAYDQSYKRRLIEKAEGLGVARSVRFLENVPQEDLIAMINSADFCLHPSTKEGFGLAVVEEMACGRAVIAFNIDAIPEIIDDRVDGLLIEPNATEELTRSILELLDDPQLAKRLGDAARLKVASKFTWDQTAIRLERIYSEVLW